MRPDLNPSLMTPDERLREVAAVLAAGILRLRDRAGLAPDPGSAQFEREIVSERTRDKIAAARRKGKWAGGHPLLGYDIDPNGFKLLVNDQEAAQVRTIFKLYAEREALLPV